MREWYWQQFCRSYIWGDEMLKQLNKAKHTPFINDVVFKNFIEQCSELSNEQIAYFYKEKLREEGKVYGKI